ncbi:MAG: hypothetical protein ACRCSF_02585, partial [Mycobacteriaceae bacterium]
MAPPLVVDPTAFLSASHLFTDVNDSALRSAYSLTGVLNASAGMAGTDTAGTQWGHEYDNTAETALSAWQGLVESSQKISELLHATGANHADADAQSTIGGGVSDYPADSFSGQTCQVMVSTIPSSVGVGMELSGLLGTTWNALSAAVGYAWPNGHQDRLREAGTAWQRASEALTRDAEPIYQAISLVAAQQSPEVELAIGKLTH